MKLLIALLFNIVVVSAAQSQVVNIVFTSDVHYGITRPHFRGRDSVASYIVNAAQVAAIKSLPHFDALVITGDIANREEAGVQQAAVSWKQFLHDYKQGLHTQLLVTPGNHDASNASAHPKITTRDVSSMTGMILMEQGVKIDTSKYNYHIRKLNYSRNIGGVHCMFVNIWPDSANRIWMEKDLASVSKKMPVMIFTHDPPQGDAKHFTNHKNVLSENLLEEIYKDSVPGSTEQEQTGFIEWLKKHPNVKAYFHGHENFCEMYDYMGIPVFRSDSPMKGKDSREDETKLSFQLITLDIAHHKMVVKECLWNTGAQANKMVFGKTRNVHL